MNGAPQMTRRQDDAIRRLARSHPTGINFDGDLADWLTSEGLAVPGQDGRLLPTRRCAVLGAPSAFQTLTARRYWSVDSFADWVIALWVATGIANVDSNGVVRLAGPGLDYVSNPHTRIRHVDGDA